MTASRLAAVLAAAALCLAACGGDEPAGVAAPTQSPAASPGTASPSPATSPTTSPASEAPATEAPSGEGSEGAAGAVAVYWIMDTTGGPRLYREFQTRASSGDAVTTALEAMLEGQPDDPDYTSLWPDATQVLGVEVDGGTATVDLSEEVRGGQGGSAFEQASVQQLVHTVTAADTAIDAVRLLVGGEPVETLWGAVDLAGPVSRAPSFEVLGPVWLLTPPEGGTLAQGEEFGGVATVFEATVSWEWRQGSEVVAEGFSTATEGGPGRGDWTAEVDVPPGDYVLEAFESSAQDGSRTFVDSKRVTVTA